MGVLDGLFGSDGSKKPGNAVGGASAVDAGSKNEPAGGAGGKHAIVLLHSQHHMHDIADVQLLCCC